MGQPLPKHTHWCHFVDPSLRPLIGHALVADMQYVLNCQSLQALLRAINGERPRKKNGRYSYSSQLSKWRRGVDLPADESLMRLRELTGCPEIARALDQWLWFALDYNNALLIAEDRFMRRLPVAVQQILYAPRSGVRRPLRRWPLDERTVLGPLSRLGTPDALVALLSLLVTRSPVWEVELPGHDVAVHTLGLVSRLIVFPPFFETGAGLFDHVATYVDRAMHYYFENSPETNTSWRPDRATVLDQFVSAARTVLQHAGALGLVGPAFQDQAAFVHAYHIAPQQEKVLSITTEITDQIHRTSAPVRLGRSNPLYAFLMRMDHPAVRSGRPLILPRRSPPGAGFRIANALGPVPQPCGARTAKPQ